MNRRSFLTSLAAVVFVRPLPPQLEVVFESTPYLPILHGCERVLTAADCERLFGLNHGAIARLGPGPIGHRHGTEA